MAVRSSFWDPSVEDRAADLTAPSGRVDAPVRPPGGRVVLRPTEPITAPGTTPVDPSLKGNWAAFGAAWLASGGKTPEQLKAFVDSHPEYGAVVFGSKNSKVTIGGRSFDAIYATSDPARARGSWDDITDGGGGGQAAIDPATLGDLMKPFPGTMPTNAPLDLPAFEAPSPEAALNDPGYKFRTAEGAQRLEGSAAARGVLNTGGTLKDILNYGQNAASQEYQNVFDRSKSAYQANYQRAWDTQTTTHAWDWDKYMQQYNQFRNKQLDDFQKLYGFTNLGLQANA